VSSLKISQREQQLKAEQKLQLAEEKLRSAEAFEQEAVKKLQEIAAMSTEEAKQFLFSRLEEELREEFRLCNVS